MGSTQDVGTPEGDQSLEEFRRTFREQASRRYNGWLHLALVSVTCIATILLCVRAVERPTTLALLVVPATLLYANWAEFFGHRRFMHGGARGSALAKRMFARHAEHHRFFPEAAMGIESHRDMHMVLFPPTLLFFFLGLLTAPVAFGLAYLAGKNVGLLFGASATTYYLLYEWTHLSFHLPRTSWVWKIPGMAFLGRHHTQHHNPRLARHYNFNFVLPLCDVLAKTVYREGDAPLVGVGARDRRLENK
jgi:hypothetical protein